MAKRALIEFFLIESVLYIFLIRPDDPELGVMDEEPILLEVELSEQEVNQLVDDLRRAIYGALTGSSTEGGEAWQSFAALGQRIFSAELMDLLAPYEALYIVPYGPLHYLPLHALQFKGEYLIERFQIAYLPSSSVLGYLRKDVKEEGQLDKNSILVGGVDYTGEYAEFALEAEQIWALEGWDRAKSQCLTRKALKKQAFFEHCYDKKVIHLSSHGYFSEEDPMNSGTLLAGEYSSEFNEKRQVSPQDKNHILMVEDFFQLEQSLQADLFVMSACVTGESVNRAGDELIGLTRGLMYAGVSTMIVSLFPTIKNVTANRQDKSLRFARFYEFWLHEGQTKGEAFQSYIKGLSSNPQFQHPMYWSPFILVGKFN